MKINWKDPSLWTLLLANLITIYFAVVENWNLSTVFLVYWTQSLIIGFFNILRILSAKIKPGTTYSGVELPSEFKRPKEIGYLMSLPTFFSKIILATLFSVHFVFFSFIFFLLFFRIDFLGRPILQMRFENFGLSVFFILLFFLSHASSYYFNYMKKNEREMDKNGLVRLFTYPYARIAPMMISVILAIVAVWLSNFNWLVLVAFLLIKTAADVKMHMLEHERG